LEALLERVEGLTHPQRYSTCASLSQLQHTLFIELSTLPPVVHAKFEDMHKLLMWRPARHAHDGNQSCVTVSAHATLAHAR